MNKIVIVKDFLQLLSLMLTVDPKQRPTAAQLLTHHVFTNVQFDISHIPIAYAEEVGLKGLIQSICIHETFN
ncbi:MAG: hypothetical protein EZS28_056619 [Streblomastix strix]|uniref:Protein kinase domain-containing protein n=1 Tax=Streblomastix strix TaxID=222440 RepID=A0A5J4PJX5_9EUKA|nr:MAG: hypothetical protein EZS28_056619 [Streblomastix strix]